MALILGACSAKSDEKSAAQAPAEQLIVWADAEPDGGDAPLTVTFRCDPLGETGITSYEWDFGDGSPKVKEASPSHTYQKPGSYTARLVVGDAKGGKGEDDMVIDVEAP